MCSGQAIAEWLSVGDVECDEVSLRKLCEFECIHSEGLYNEKIAEQMFADYETAWYSCDGSECDEITEEFINVFSTDVLLAFSKTLIPNCLKNVGINLLGVLLTLP